MKNTIIGFLVLIGITALVGVLFMNGHKKLTGNDFINTYTTTPQAVLVDVRTPDEFSSGHIPNALNIDFQNTSFVSEVKKLDTNKTYFVYCRSGNRSEQAIRIMKQNGIKNIYELQGGLLANTNHIQLTTN